MSVGPVVGPVQRPGDDRDFSEIFRRLTDLERSTSGSGWRFKTINGDGSPAGWGWVEFNDSTDHEFGELALGLVDRTGQGMLFYTAAGSTTASILLTPDQIAIGLSGMSLVIDRGSGTFTLFDSNGDPMLRMTDGSPDLHLPTGGNVIFDL